VRSNFGNVNSGARDALRVPEAAVQSAARLVVKDRPAGSVALGRNLDLEDEFLLGVHGDPHLATFSPGRLRKEVMPQNFGLLDFCTHCKTVS
jgi:hypothetical protein